MVVNSSFSKFFTHILPYGISESQNELGRKMQTSTVLMEAMLPSVWWSELPLFHHISKISKSKKLVHDVAYSHHIHSFSLNTICLFLKWGGSCSLPSLEYWRAWIYREMLGSQTIKVMIFRTMKSPYFLHDNRNLTVELRVLEINKPDNFSDHDLTKNLGAQIICEISLQHAHQNFAKVLGKSLCKWVTACAKHNEI